MGQWQSFLLLHEMQKMKTTFAIFLILLLTIVLAHRLLARAFQAEVARQEQVILNAPIPETRNLNEIPERMRLFAQKGLASESDLPRSIRLTQEVEILKGGKWVALLAHQLIAVAETGFVWIGEQSAWPVPLVQVIDSFTNGKGHLEVRLLGAIRVARFDGPYADVGEAMRYLIELPWVPDAILSNPSINWRVIYPDLIEAELPVSSQSVSVQFRFDDMGDVVEIVAQGRPDISTGDVVLREWRGLFSDYGQISGRRIPLTAEVGYVNDGVYAPYFRGRITSYQMNER